MKTIYSSETEESLILTSMEQAVRVFSPDSEIAKTAQMMFADGEVNIKVMPIKGGSQMKSSYEQKMDRQKASKTKREAKQSYQKKLKEGRAFNVENHTIFYTWEYIGANKGFKVTGGIFTEETNEGINLLKAKLAYSICSPNDEYSPKIARSMIGNRLKNQEDTYYETFVPAIMAYEQGVKSVLINSFEGIYSTVIGPRTFPKKLRKYLTDKL